MGSRIILLACMVILLFMGTFFSYNRENFNEEKWCSTTEKQREGMANDLIARNLLIGKSLEEVNEMLGRDYGYISGYPNTIAYYLGNTYWGEEYKGFYKCLDLTIKNDTIIRAKVRWDEWYYELDG